MISRPSYGWWVAVAAFFDLLIAVGLPFYGLPFFYDYMQHDFAWSRAQITSGIGVATILVLPLGGLIIPRFKPKSLILCGILLLCASLCGFALMGRSLITYYLMWALFMLGYLCAGPIPHQVLIARWFTRRRGTAMACAYLGLGIGGAISQKYVALPLIHAFGWRGALLAMGLLLLALIPLVTVLVKDCPSEPPAEADNRSSYPPAASEPLPLRSIFRITAFWVLAFASFASIGSIGSVNQHMKLLFHDAGLSGQVAADITYVMLTSSLIGRIVMGFLADRLPRKYVMIAAYLAIALSLPLLFVASRPGVPFLFGIVFGFGLGADYMLIPLMAADLFGTNSLARVMGILLPADSIAQTVCPLLVGLLYSHSGSYQTALFFISALAILGAVALCFLPGTRVSSIQAHTDLGFRVST
jgi:MFS family permease